MRTSEKYFAAILVLLIAVFIYHTFVIFHIRYCTNSLNECRKLQKDLYQVLAELKSLRHNHSQLRIRIKIFPELINASLRLAIQTPTEEYEKLRRKIYSNTKELWYYMEHQINRTLKNITLKQRESIITEVAERKRWLLSDLESLLTLDGYEDWRRREEASVSDLIQRRLHHLQNPSDCRTARTLVCQHDEFGFGCNLHHIVFCLINAYSMARTLVLSYCTLGNPMNEWTNVFHPISDTCTEASVHNIPSLAADRHYNETVVYLPREREFRQLHFRPFYIPKDLAKRIARFKGDPYSWWVGQFLKYIIKLQNPIVLDDLIEKLNFTTPIVGVHVRRTDKLIIAEAEYHHIDEYMTHVDDYYTQLELTHSVDQRRVYLATDNVDVLEEAIAKYPQYKFYGDYYKTRMAAVKARYTPKGLSNFLLDLHMLAKCDYVVGTFSSNVGRIAYELMQSTRTDASNRFFSLDHLYYYTDKDKHLRIAVNRNLNDTAFEVGDLIQYTSKEDDFNINGTVLRTNMSGKFPLYKTNEYTIQYQHPEYSMVPLFAETTQDDSL